MATADEYAKWIVDNADKRGTEQFETVSKAYKEAKADKTQTPVTQPPPTKAPPPQQKAPSLGTRIGGAAADVIGGAVEIPVSMVTGVAAQSLSGLLGLTTTATNFLGLTEDDTVGIIRKWQQLGYEPQTKTARATLDAMGSAVSKAEKLFGLDRHKLGEGMFQQTGSPLVATVAELLPDAIETIAGGGSGTLMKDAAFRGAARLAIKAATNAVKDENFRAAKVARLKVAPTDHGGGLARSIAGVSNPAEIERMVSYDNIDRSGELARINMQMPETAPLDKQSYAAARRRMSRPYAEAGSLGNILSDKAYRDAVDMAGTQRSLIGTDFSDTELGELNRKLAEIRTTFRNQKEWDAQSAMRQMEFLRDRASGLLRETSPVERQTGFVYREIAEAIEDRLWRAAQLQKNFDLANRFQSARIKLAQLHVWEDATDFDTGKINPRLVHAQHEMMRTSRVDPFTDELKLVAESAGAFPRSFQWVPQKGRFPMSYFEMLATLGTAGAGAGHLIGKTGAEIGLAAGLGRSAARHGIASKAGQLMQRGPIRGSPSALRAAGEVAEEGGAITGAAAGAQDE